MDARRDEKKFLDSTACCVCVLLQRSAAWDESRTCLRSGCGLGALGSPMDRTCILEIVDSPCIYM